MVTVTIRDRYGAGRDWQGYYNGYTLDDVVARWADWVPCCGHWLHSTPDDCPPPHGTTFGDFADFYPEVCSA